MKRKCEVIKTPTVKIRLFKAFCICFYDIGLWSNFKLGTINKLAAAYTRCLKNFFGFYKYSSVTDMLLQLGLPTFNIILYNNRFSCKSTCTRAWSPFLIRSEFGETRFQCQCDLFSIIFVNSDASGVRLLQCNPRRRSADNNRQVTTSVKRCCTSRQ